MDYCKNSLGVKMIDKEVLHIIIYMYTHIYIYLSTVLLLTGGKSDTGARKYKKKLIKINTLLHFQHVL